MRDLIPKITKMKRSRGLAQVVEYLLSRHEALRSKTPALPKKKEISSYTYAQVAWTIVLLYLCFPLNWDDRCTPSHPAFYFLLFLNFIYFALLGLKLRAYTLSHLLHQAFFVMIFFFEIGSCINYLLRLASNYDPSDLCLLSS
jgi:hypothetical protein